MVEEQCVVECAENTASRRLNGVSSDNFSGAAGIDDKEADSVMAVNKKENVSAMTVKEKEGGHVAEEVVVARRHRREKGAAPLHESTMELLKYHE